MADDDAGHAGEAVAGEIERAIRRDCRTAQTDLVPDRWHGGAQVRVVRKDRLAGVGEGARNDPGIGADFATGRTEQLGDGCERGAQLGEGGGERGLCGHLVRSIRRRGRCGGVHRLALDDCRVCGVWVGRMQFGDLGGGELRGQQRSVDLVVEVGTQIPGHRLQPGNRVGRRPGFGFVVRVLQVKHRILEGQVCTLMGGQVGVHAVRVGLVVAERDGVEQLDFFFCDRAPAERANEGVCTDLALPE